MFDGCNFHVTFFFSENCSKFFTVSSINPIFSRNPIRLFVEKNFHITSIEEKRQRSDTKKSSDTFNTQIRTDLLEQFAA